MDPCWASATGIHVANIMINNPGHHVLIIQNSVVPAISITEAYGLHKLWYTIFSLQLSMNRYGLLYYSDKFEVMPESVPYLAGKLSANIAK